MYINKCQRLRCSGLHQLFQRYYCIMVSWFLYCLLTGHVAWDAIPCNEHIKCYLGGVGMLIGVFTDNMAYNKGCSLKPSYTLSKISENIFQEIPDLNYKHGLTRKSPLLMMLLHLYAIKPTTYTFTGLYFNYKFFYWLVQACTCEEGAWRWQCILWSGPSSPK